MRFEHGVDLLEFSKFWFLWFNKPKNSILRNLFLHKYWFHYFTLDLCGTYLECMSYAATTTTTCYQ